MVIFFIYAGFALLFIILASVLLNDPRERVQSWMSFCTASIFLVQAIVQATHLGK